jgi:hypothetical protein
LKRGALAWVWPGEKYQTGQKSAADRGIVQAGRPISTISVSSRIILAKEPTLIGQAERPLRDLAELRF